MMPSHDHPPAPPSNSGPVPPPLPIAKRLNRNALTIVAVLMFVTVLGAVLTTRTTHGNTATANPETAVPVPVTPPQPSFLDVPAVRQAATGPSMSSNTLPPPRGVAFGDAGRNDSSKGSPSGMSAWNTSDIPGGPMPPNAEPTVDPTMAAYRRALTSAVIVGRTDVTAGTAQIPVGDTSENAVLRMLASESTGSRPPTINGGLTTGTATNILLPSSHAAFMASAATTAPTRLDVAVTPATSHNQLDAGTVIPAVLMTGINSELPGHLLAYVTHNVYDSRTQRVVVIPQGTKLLGEYESTVAAGQSRLLVAWTRLILPDGQSVTLPGLVATDPKGAAGISGHVDNHDRRLFGNALLLSVIGAGVQLSQPQQSAIGLTAPSARQIAAGAVGDELSQVATEIIRKNLDIPPTVTLEPGTPFNVFLNADLVLPPVVPSTEPAGSGMTPPQDAINP